MSSVQIIMSSQNVGRSNPNLPVVRFVAGRSRERVRKRRYVITLSCPHHLGGYTWWRYDDAPGIYTTAATEKLRGESALTSPSCATRYNFGLTAFLILRAALCGSPLIAGWLWDVEGKKRSYQIRQGEENGQGTVPTRAVRLKFASRALMVEDPWMGCCVSSALLLYRLRVDLSFGLVCWLWCCRDTFHRGVDRGSRWRRQP